MDELEEIKKLADTQKPEELTDGFRKPIAVGDIVAVADFAQVTAYIGKAEILKYNGDGMFTVEFVISTSRPDARGMMMNVHRRQIMKI